MTHVTCRLTAKNRDQLGNSTLGNRVWATFWRRLATYSNVGLHATSLLYQFLCQPVMQLCIASNNILLNLAFPFRRLWRWHYSGFRLRSTSLWGTIRAYNADCARSYRSDPFPRLWNARSAVITYEFATVSLLNSEQFIWAVRYTELKYSDGHFRLFCI